jgi:cysteinyl-tRNA synthetase
MDDDLDTPAAMALVFDLVRAANVALDAGDPAGAGPLVAALTEVAGALGLVLGDGREEVLDPETAALVDRRDQARAGRDWAAVNVLRTELEAKGWAVEDGAAGTRVRRR